MLRRTAILLALSGLLVLAGAKIVHWLNGAWNDETTSLAASGEKRRPAAGVPASRATTAAKVVAAAGPRIHYGIEGVPAPVAEMIDQMRAAIRSGRVEDLKVAYEWNELRPSLAEGPVGDPVAHWRKISGDGEGREVLAALAELLDSGYVVLPLGKDIENNRVFVWPYFAEMPVDRLTPGQEVELLRLVTPAEAQAMRSAKFYTHWRLGIGTDGTWHFFQKLKPPK